MFQSKVFWINVITGLSLFLALPELQDVVPESALRYLLLAQAGLNIILRRITSEAVTWTGRAPTMLGSGGRG